MIVANRFAIGLPVDDAWPLVSDLERVAPLMPGVQVEQVDDAGLHVRMRVKVGPITVSYKMLVTTESLDEQSHTAVLRATGREVRGQGTVAASVTAVLEPDDGRTSVALTTDVDVTGRVAQLGSGVMEEVASRLLAQFAERLEADLTAAPAAGERSADDAPRPQAPPPEPADLGGAASAVLAPRLAWAAAALAALAALVALARRRR